MVATCRYRTKFPEHVTLRLIAHQRLHLPLRLAVMHVGTVRRALVEEMVRVGVAAARRIGGDKDDAPHRRASGSSQQVFGSLYIDSIEVCHTFRMNDAGSVEKNCAFRAFTKTVAIRALPEIAGNNFDAV